MRLGVYPGYFEPSLVAYDISNYQEHMGWLLYSLSFLYNDTYPDLFHNQCTSVKLPVKSSLGLLKSPFFAIMYATN